MYNGPRTRIKKRTRKTNLLIAGCDDTSSPRDTTPPAAPRGFYSVTGDGSVTLHWLAAPRWSL